MFNVIFVIIYPGTLLMSCFVRIFAEAQQFVVLVSIQHLSLPAFVGPSTAFPLNLVFTIVYILFKY